ncbi:MAG: glycoside hydrolase family 9 protein [Terriglobia bacterium]
MRFFRISLIVVCLSCFGMIPSLASDAKIALNDQEYFSGPGFSFLLFHNNYQVGYQGGLQMILHDERVADSGDLLLTTKSGVPRPELQVLRREVDRAHETATVFAEVAGWNFGYQLITRSDGASISVTLKLDRALDWSKVEQAGIKMALYPGTYFEKSFQGNSDSGVFPQQFTGRSLLLGPSKLLRIAQEDPLHSFTIERDDGPLTIVDTRRDGPESWYLMVAPIASGSDVKELTIRITPRLDAQWQRAPVIGVSQVGFLPKQKKRAVLELDPRDTSSAAVNLFKLETRGEPKLVKSEAPKPWGKFLRFQYAVFDFSDASEPGVYTLEYRGQTVGPIRIAEGVYDDAWQPTLEYFLPVQMCHVAVKEGNRTWHGACHLDDAAQAPAHKVWIDGYNEGEHETPYQDDQHVPGLDWGGWHDAGDYDLPAGSVAHTTLALALAQEEFRPDVDDTSIRRLEREVLLHRPDRKPDLLQQIEFGAESLLAFYRVAGHVVPGIIERTDEQYTFLGDPVNITDNRVYDPVLKEQEVSGERSGRRDDRWVFTNRNTGLQYIVAQSLAAASRSLRGYNDALAVESLRAAEELWQYEQAHPPVFAPNSYVPRSDDGFHSQELAAAAELLITTGKSSYRDRLVSLVPVLKSITGEQFGMGPGWVLVRALDKVESPDYRSAVRDLAKKWKVIADERAASNPWGVHYPPGVSRPEYRLETRSHIHSGFVWGEGWRLQDDAFRQYYFHRAFPELFGIDPLLATVDFVLGAHPANNRSFVSGVGAESPLMAYGINRADWSHIPGGVISGASLIKPDYMELKKFPFLWYQTEYVIGGAATYIFDLLAVEKLAGR